MLKKIFNLVGLNIERYRPLLGTQAEIYNAIKKVKTNIIFDIGANTGQFGLEVRQRGYEGKIISFEPLTSARNKLLENASGDASWVVHDRTAIGDYIGSIEINISKNSFSSSVLPMLNSHSDVEPDSVYIGNEKTSIITIDSIANEYLNKSSNCFIKIDTQGYEWQVLDGAYKTLGNAKGIICELSLLPLYEGQQLWRQIIERLEEEGFVLWALHKAFSDKNNGRTLQLDAVFLRKDAI